MQTAGGDIHTTSSAEYIVEGVKRHKRGAALVLAALVVAIAALAYFYFVRSGKAVNQFGGRYAVRQCQQRPEHGVSLGRHQREPDQRFVAAPATESHRAQLDLQVQGQGD